MHDDPAERHEASAPQDLFNPIGFIVLAFGTEADAGRAADALLAAHFGQTDVIRYSGHAVLTSADGQHPHRGILSYLSEEAELAVEYQELAGQGGGFVLVRASTDDDVERVLQIARQGDLRRATQYGELTFTDLK